MVPPGGGGAPPDGAMLAQVIQQLMQSPAAMQGMQNFMQGQPPTAGMPDPGMMQQMMAAQGGGGPPPGMPPGGEMPPMEEEGDAPPDAEAMATQQIDSAGATWDGVDAPTKNDIERLMEDPEGLQASFDAQFGDGMAAKYTGSGGSDEASEGEAPAEEAEYDE